MNSQVHDTLAEQAWGVLVAAGMATGDAIVTAHAIARNQAPVVARLVTQRAAYELELAGVLTVPSQDTSEEVREALFRRADEIAAEETA
jgi:hypothetical protein